MNKTFSLLLDLSRLLAALLVFFHHAEQITKDRNLSALASFGHDSVVFFFILSGFVIAYVTRHKEKNLVDYATARLARLYSVALPSLVLTYGLFLTGNHFFPASYPAAGETDWATVLLSGMVFLNGNVPTNAPYWSICYEAWYYVLFGLFFYLQGYRKYLFLLAGLLMAGLNIMLLMPIWLLGFACFGKQDALPKNKVLGYALIVLSLGVYLWMRHWNVDDQLFEASAVLLGGAEQANATLHFSKRYLPDYLIACLFVVLFAGLYMVRDDFQRGFSFCEKGIRLASSYTFALYLYHYPILLFLSHVTDSSLKAISICLALVIALGHLTEKQKPLLATSIQKLFRLGQSSTQV